VVGLAVRRHAVEAHRAYQRFEEEHRMGEGREDPIWSRHGRQAALLVAATAAFLAVATFLANEAVKEVITGETHRADASAVRESNLVKIDIADGNARLLRLLGAANPQERHALRIAALHRARIAHELQPVDRRLGGRIEDHKRDVDHANTQHVLYELAEVGLEVGIVLASVSIIARRRWLLGIGGAAASAGVVLLAVGLLH
jgi:uncharacterized protein DUF4337